MKRALWILPASEWCRADAIDRVLLDADERHRRRIMLTGESGTRFLLDLPQATALRDGDGLVLEDGSIVCVVGKGEALVEVTAENAAALVRLAWDALLKVSSAGVDDVLTQMVVSAVAWASRDFNSANNAIAHDLGTCVLLC